MNKLYMMLGALGVAVLVYLFISFGLNGCKEPSELDIISARVDCILNIQRHIQQDPQFFIDKICELKGEGPNCQFVEGDEAYVMKVVGDAVYQCTISHLKNGNFCTEDVQ